MEKQKKLIFLALFLLPIIAILVFVIFSSVIYSFDFSKLCFFYILNIIYSAIHLSVMWGFFRILTRNIHLSKRTISFVIIILILMIIIGFIGYNLMYIFDTTDYRFNLGLAVAEIQLFGFDFAGFLKLYYE